MIAKVKIEETSTKESKVAKNGNRYTPCGIKVEGKWYNQILFDKDVKKFEEIKQGNIIELVFYQEDYEGITYNKFKFPGKLDMLEARIEVLEKLVSLPMPTKEEPKQENQDIGGSDLPL